MARGLVVLAICPEAQTKRLARVLQAEGADAVVLGHRDEDELYALLLGEAVAGYAVQAIIPVSEHASLPVAYAAEALRLPGPTVRAATLSRRKDLQRQVLRQFRPRYAATASTGPIAVEPPADAFPLILKPAGLSGSRGIRVVASLAEWRTLEALDQTHVAESFISGVEFSVEAVFRQGDLCFAGVARKSVNATFAEIGHQVGPDLLDPASRQKLIETAVEVAARSGLNTGFLHAEFKVDGDVVHLIEFAVRPPGDALVQLHSLSIGRPLEEIMLSAHLDQQVTTPTVSASAGQRYLEQGRGTFRAVTAAGPGVALVHLGDGEPWPDWNEWQANQRFGLIHIPRGSAVVPLQTNFERVASVVAHGQHLSQQDVELVCQSLTLELDPV